MGAHSRAEPSREPRQDGGAWTHPGGEAQAITSALSAFDLTGHLLRAYL